MTVRETSLIAYKTHVIPKLSDTQKKILEIYQGNTPLTDREVQRLIGWDINSVCNRCGELRTKGCLEFVERRPCRITGNPANSYRVKSVDSPKILYF